MTQHDDGVTVEIGLREIYDKVLETHGAVQMYGPRLDAVEKKADEALSTANKADILSQENKKQQRLMWKILGTLGSGAALTYIGDIISKHIH
ncbi:hypothetical protein ACOALA_04135 [Alicyclobacillus acidoterrestris]|uniref:hypothetical protein n=1 Tax=Alicyclobacillus acidoterrestris TaxID=1450 RepID=UPI003F529BCC